jgi:hypothetical protein
METQTKSQNLKKELFFKDIKVRGELASYSAWVGDYAVRGITKADEEGIKSLVARMSEAKADLIDKLERMVASVAESAVANMEAGIMDISMYAGTSFHLGEYLGVVLKIRWSVRVYNRWWGVTYAVFKGYDGLITNSRHVVRRYVEFPEDVNLAELYSAIYQATRMAYNAYGWAHRFR